MGILEFFFFFYVFTFLRRFLLLTGTKAGNDDDDFHALRDYDHWPSYYRPNVEKSTPEGSGTSTSHD